MSPGGGRPASLPCQAEAAIVLAEAANDEEPAARDQPAPAARDQPAIALPPETSQPLVAEPSDQAVRPTVRLAAFEQPSKPMADSLQAAVAVHIAQTVASITARSGMAGNWKPGPGRPKGRGRPAAGISAGSSAQFSGHQKRKLAARGRRDLTVEQKLSLANQMVAIFTQTGCSRRSCFEHQAGKLQCTPATVRKIYDNRAAWQKAVAAQSSRPMDPGKAETALKVGRKVKGQNSAIAKRQAAADRGYLGRTDHLRSERMAVKSWAEWTEGNGHFLGRQELFRQFHMRVRAKEADLLSKQTDPGLVGEESKQLAAAQTRLAAWQCAKSREKATKKLLSQCNFTEKNEPSDKTRLSGRDCQTAFELAAL